MLGLGKAEYVGGIRTPHNTMKTKTPSIIAAVIAVFILLVAGVSAKAGLRIEKALCGAKGSWCDATAFLQSKVQDDTLSAKIGFQPKLTRSQTNR